MTDDKLQSIWNKSGRERPVMDQAAIARILEQAARSGWSGMRFNVRLFLAALILCEVFHILNLAASAPWTGWCAVHAALAVVTWAFFMFGLRVLRELRALDGPDQSLATLVKSQLRFFHTTFEWWLWTWAITVWMVSFCIVVWVENREGGYRVGHVFTFVAVSAGVVFGSYALFRLGHYPMIQRALATLHDLETQIIDQTQRVQKQQKYWVIGVALLVIALTAVFVWTCHLWLSVTP